MTDLVAARIEQMAQSVFPLVPSSEHALQALQAAMNNERRQQVRLPLCSTQHVMLSVYDAASAAAAGHICSPELVQQWHGPCCII